LLANVEQQRRHADARQDRPKVCLGEGVQHRQHASGVRVEMIATVSSTAY
jgi:hypothetical protein